MTNSVAPPEGELCCSVHLSSTVKSLMDDGGAILLIREIQRHARDEVVWYCTCRLVAEFYIINVGRADTDDPFPIFRKL